MKVAIAVLALVAYVLARPGPEDDHSHFNQQQQDVWDVVKYINNPIYHKEHAQIAHSYSVQDNAQHYKNEAVEHFFNIHHDQWLKKGEIFSIFNDEHVHQAEALFRLFYNADSYQTFHHTALWARHHLSEGLFLYTYSVAIVHRPDTQHLVLPPIYEMYPHYFFNAEVINKAYKLKMSHYGHHQEHQTYTIHSNYSGHYLNLDPEQSLSYYHEDVGINAFYFYVNLYFPYWMSSEEFHFEHYNRGEIFHYLHKQLAARYHLERVSHGLGEVEYFNWDVPFKTGYYPSLTYTNGLAFPERPHFANLKEYIHHYGERKCDKSNYGFAYTFVQTYEQRIREAVDSGFVIDHEGNKHHLYTEEGMNVLGNLIEGNVDSPNHRYYGSYLNMARHVLGYAKEPLDHHKLAPSALEHYATTLRDPAFYQILKKVHILVDQYKQNLAPYHHEHLYHQGIKVQHVEVEPMVTFYDHHHSDITNGLYVTPEEYETDSFKVKVHQYRLNHKNFNYKVHVNSQKEGHVVVKVFLGPKYDEHGRPLHLSQIHDKVFEIDHFVHQVKNGENVITRNSAQFHGCGQETEHTQYQQGFPLRYKLPRGSEDGTSFQLYVIVYPYEVQNHEQQHEVEGHHHPLACLAQYDQYPLGYPFDRPVEHDDVYHVSNAHVKHVKVYHQVNRNMHHDDVEPQNQEEHVYQHGDHNNYRQYHYQHHDDEQVHHADSQNYHQNQWNEHHVPQVGEKHQEYAQHGLQWNEHHVPQVHEKHQEFAQHGLQWNEHQVPQVHEQHQEYTQQGIHHGYKNVGVKQFFENVEEYKPYYGKHEVTGKHHYAGQYEQEDDYETTHKPYNYGHQYSGNYGKHHVVGEEYYQGQYPEKTHYNVKYTPYHKQVYGDDQEYQTVGHHNKYHGGHHYYSSEE